MPLETESMTVSDLGDATAHRPELPAGLSEHQKLVRLLVDLDLAAYGLTRDIHAFSDAFQALSLELGVSSWERIDERKRRGRW